jgi:hypothetical protein
MEYRYMLIVTLPSIKLSRVRYMEEPQYPGTSLKNNNPHGVATANRLTAP